jgi:2-dehydro-3-deoxyphosphogluconate aldolase/(4S)-4-hydroxy-2-oxoglutarate aldolase
MSTSSPLDIIYAQKLLPLYFHKDEEVSKEILKALYHAGIRAVEYTNRGVEALQNFKALIALRDNELKGLQLGIGTIKTAEEANTYIKAGADYIISPGFVPEVAAECIKQNKLWIPGCMTVSEIIAAEKAGAAFIKLFPGNILGPDFMSAIKDLFPHVKFMPTGGVDLTKENIGAWFKSGVVVVGMGSKLISKELMEAKNYAAIADLTKKALEIVGELKK